MTKVCFIVSVLICASPGVLIWDGLIAEGMVAGVVAVTLATTAGVLRPSETVFVISTTRSALMVAALPALWILIQVCPLGVLAHPIWTSAQLALEHPIRGTISIDPGMSTIALGRNILLSAVAFLSAAVAADRQRADRLLHALTLAGSTTALIVLTHDRLFPSFLPSPYTSAQMADCAAIGAIIAATAFVRTIERHRIDHSGNEPAWSPRKFPISAGGFLICLAICITALILSGSNELIIAAGCGLAAFACVVIIRHFALGRWGRTAITAAAISLVAVIAANQPSHHGKSLLLAFAEQKEAGSTDVSQRVLNDAPLVGTGAGTYGSLAMIYREMDDPPSSSVASTTAVAFAIELGWPLVWLIGAASISAVFLLLTAALRRGRDWFYSAMGGSCFITLFLSAFINAGLLGTTTGLIAAAAFGLAIAQSKSRATQL